MDYIAENISSILGSILLLGIVLFFLGTAVNSHDERKRVRDNAKHSAREKSQNDKIQALLKAKRFEAARKQNEAPIDKNGSYCGWDEQTGKWLSRNKNGTWSEYRP